MLLSFLFFFFSACSFLFQTRSRGRLILGSLASITCKSPSSGSFQHYNVFLHLHPSSTLPAAELIASPHPFCIKLLLTSGLKLSLRLSSVIEQLSWYELIKVSSMTTPRHETILTMFTAQSFQSTSCCRCSSSTRRTITSRLRSFSSSITSAT